LANHLQTSLSLQSLPPPPPPTKRSRKIFDAFGCVIGMIAIRRILLYLALVTMTKRKILKTKKIDHPINRGVGRKDSRWPIINAMVELRNNGFNWRGRAPWFGLSKFYHVAHLGAVLWSRSHKEPKLLVRAETITIFCIWLHVRQGNSTP
jgi:hypothetical protein